MEKLPNWTPSLVYWVEDGKPDPDVRWPENWEVCGYPREDPLAFGNKEKRPGNLCLAMPMYRVQEPIEELQRICSFLERMPESERENWIALQDRQLTFSCSDTEMDDADMDNRGFEIPGPVLQRVRGLRIRLMIGFHPGTDVLLNIVY